MNVDWLYILMIVFGSCCFGIIFRVPRRFFLFAVLVGVISGSAPHFFPDTMNAAVVTFFVAFGVACLSNAIARVSGTPAQGLLIPGVIFLVPGAKVYRAFTAAVTESSGEASPLVLEAVLVTVAISFGLLIANWLVPVRKTL